MAVTSGRPASAGATGIASGTGAATMASVPPATALAAGMAACTGDATSNDAGQSSMEHLPRLVQRRGPDALRDYSARTAVHRGRAPVRWPLRQGLVPP